MALNKLALIRYKTIDSCLQNRFKKWTLDDLVEACSDAIYDAEGIVSGVSKRTIQLDIQTMRSDKLGYSAPIIVTDRKFYTYEDSNYSITNIPLSEHDLGTLTQITEMLRQFKGFGYFGELSDIITRLEAKVNVKDTGKSFIDFEKNERMKGLEFIDPLHKCILNNRVVEIKYQSFKSKGVNYFVVSPYLLKEHRNRWFLLCRKINDRHPGIMTLALDRMLTYAERYTELYEKPPFDVHKFYENAIGVTKSIYQRPVDVILKVRSDFAPYIRTKPLHNSQIELKNDEDFVLFKIKVILNFELERDILAFGEQVEVLGPRHLRNIIKKRLKKAYEKYLTADESNSTL